jgi:hypothetical protein
MIPSLVLPWLHVLDQWGFPLQASKLTCERICAFRTDFQWMKCELEEDVGAAGFGQFLPSIESVQEAEESAKILHHFGLNAFVRGEGDFLVFYGNCSEPIAGLPFVS